MGIINERIAVREIVPLTNFFNSVKYIIILTIEITNADIVSHNCCFLFLYKKIIMNVPTINTAVSINNKKLDEATNFCWSPVRLIGILLPV